VIASRRGAVYTVYQERVHRSLFVFAIWLPDIQNVPRPEGCLLCRLYPVFRDRNSYAGIEPSFGDHRRPGLLRSVGGRQKSDALNIRSKPDTRRTIRLKSGKEFELSPASKPQHFKDKEGKDVKLDATDTNSSTYKWDNKNIVVNWNRGSSQSSQQAAGKSGSFETVCGVMVGGKNYRYRCTVEDHYQDSRKTSTTLRYPDQTINMVWKPGRYVDLQFEGMVPKSARYATSEGETNFVFEDKTYFYYSDKEVARREIQHFHE
jgi:hypothetical protein